MKSYRYQFYGAHGVGLPITLEIYFLFYLYLPI